MVRHQDHPPRGDVQDPDVVFGQVARLHDVPLRLVEVHARRPDAVGPRLGDEVGGGVADGELHDEVGVVRELLHLRGHLYGAGRCDGDGDRWCRMVLMLMTVHTIINDCSLQL